MATQTGATAALRKPTAALGSMKPLLVAPGSAAQANLNTEDTWFPSGQEAEPPSL